MFLSIIIASLFDATAFYRDKERECLIELEKLIINE